MISYPTVNAVITDGKASITGNFTAATASELAAKIQGGALPFALQTSNFSTVNPTLGMKSLDAMVMAGVIAFALIAVFMIIIFKIPGFAAVLTLVGQLAITFAAISGYFPFDEQLYNDSAGSCGYYPFHRRGRGCEHYHRKPY